ncbi:hypothetical protein PS2_022512 [Malus domestica]
MNPAKCAFGVSAGNFLGFLVHHRGIEVDENKARPIINAPPPTMKKQLQSLLATDIVGREQAIFYLSRNLNEPEINYFAVEKLCLAVFLAASKLRHYMLPSVTQLAIRAPESSQRRQALADFLAQHPSLYGFGGTDVEISMVATRDNYWTMYFDGSITSSSAGIGIVIQSPNHDRWHFLLKLDFECINIQAEYEALIIGLGILHNLRATRALILSDSELVINQLNRSFRCMSCTLAPYHITASYLAEYFDGITFEHISQIHNTDADELAQIAFGVQLLWGQAKLRNTRVTTAIPRIG